MTGRCLWPSTPVANSYAAAKPSFWLRPIGSLDAARVLERVTCGHRIVVVDDSPDVRVALRALLEASDFEVVAETGDFFEAVDLVVQTKPDAILLDWMFDGRPNGALALASLRRWAPQVPVVVYTAYPEEVAARAEELGAAYVATKEIANSTQLAAVLRGVIVGFRATVAGHPGPGREGWERTAAMAERGRVNSQWSRRSAMQSLDDEVDAGP